MTKPTIGIVDIETSHPPAWIPILSNLGYRVTGLYDSGRRYSKKDIVRFAQEHGVEQIYANVDDLAEAVDVGIVFTCNWDLHLAQSRPFVKRHKPVLIDKPLVGNVRDAMEIESWAKNGQVIGGGSSLRFASQAQALRNTLLAEGKQILSVYAACSGQGFYYAVHLVALAQALLGSGIRKVRQLGTKPFRIELAWQGGQTAICEVIPQEQSTVPFTATVVTNSGVEHITITDVVQLYTDFLKIVMPALAHGFLPISVDELLEIDLSLIAALQSREHADGGWVSLAELTHDSPALDGEQFYSKYLAEIGS